MPGSDVEIQMKTISESRWTALHPVRPRWRLLLFVAVVSPVLARPGLAQDSPPPSQPPIVTSGPDGLAVRSADGASSLRLRGYLQTDGRLFIAEEAVSNNDTFLIRRARPVLEGTVYGRFDFKLMPDFGQGQSVLYDAYVDVRFIPALKLRAGKFKPPIGLERLQ